MGRTYGQNGEWIGVEETTKRALQWEEKKGKAKKQVEE